MRDMLTRAAVACILLVVTLRFVEVALPVVCCRRSWAVLGAVGCVRLGVRLQFVCEVT